MTQKEKTNKIDELKESKANLEREIALLDEINELTVDNESNQFLSSKSDRTMLVSLRKKRLNLVNKELERLEK